MEGTTYVQLHAARWFYTGVQFVSLEGLWQERNTSLATLAHCICCWETAAATQLQAHLATFGLFQSEKYSKSLCHAARWNRKSQCLKQQMRIPWNIHLEKAGEWFWLFYVGTQHILVLRKKTWKKFSAMTSFAVSKLHIRVRRVWQNYGTIILKTCHQSDPKEYKHRKVNN